MKKIKFTAWIVAAALFAGTALSGCRTAEEPEEAETVEAEPVAVEDEVIQEIGDPTASLNVLLTNKMGSAVTGLSVKSPMETVYPANMMTAGQKIENDETARLFYEPVTAQDLESAEKEPVKPDSSYIGYWNTVGYEDLELTILDVTDDTVTFYMWWYHAASTEDSVVATFDSENVATFSTLINGDKEISGTITFYNDSIEVRILKSASEDVHVGSIVFDERHDSSWENGDDFTLAEEENPDGDSEEVSATESTYSLQVTMENGDVYELSNFDIEDMEEVTLYLSDGVAYIEYLSLSQNVLISTRDLELQLKAEKEAAQTSSTEARDEEAYQAGFYCGDCGYTKEDAEARAVELGYASGSSSYQDFWDGYNYGFKNREAGDIGVVGYLYGQEGHSEEEAREYFTGFGYLDDPKSQYTQAFWEGYYKGYAEYETEQENNISSQANIIGQNQGHAGHSLELAESVLKEQMGIDSSSPYYQTFLAGYYYGWSLYEADDMPEGVTEDNYYGEWEEAGLSEGYDYDNYDEEGDGGEEGEEGEKGEEGY